MRDNQSPPIREESPKSKRNNRKVAKRPKPACLLAIAAIITGGEKVWSSQSARGIIKSLKLEKFVEVFVGFCVAEKGLASVRIYVFCVGEKKDKKKVGK
jgi:hypothetical protein